MTSGLKCRLKSLRALLTILRDLPFIDRGVEAPKRNEPSSVLTLFDDRGVRKTHSGPIRLPEKMSKITYLDSLAAQFNNCN